MKRTELEFKIKCSDLKLDKLLGLFDQAYFRIDGVEKNVEDFKYKIDNKHIIKNIKFVATFWR